MRKKRMFGMLLAVAGAGLAVGVVGAGNDDGGWIDGLTYETVLAADGNSGSSTIGGGTNREVNGESEKVEGDEGGKNEESRQSEKKEDVRNVDDKERKSAESGSDGVYDFKDSKANGTVTVTKEWSDKEANKGRPELNIKISTKKPSKSTLGYTITFHGDKKNGLAFANGNYVNEVIYNLNGDVVSGSFKIPGDERMLAGWYTDTKCENKVEIGENGLPPGKLTGDLDLYAKSKTFEIKGYSGDYNRKWNEFNYMIPESVISVIFIDEVKPESASAIDVDADGDGGVVAWTENNGTVMKVSTQIKGMKVQAAKDSGHMFFDRNKLANIDFSMFDTANVESMDSMFKGCSGLTNLDLAPLNTANVMYINYMFYGCNSLKTLDLTPLDMTNVMFTAYTFFGCKNLTSLDLTPLDATYMITNMTGMFCGCSGLTSLDLTPLHTVNVRYMNDMFWDCSGLTSLDLTPLNTTNVTDMGYMFDGCSGLTRLDLTPLDTTNAENMECMFSGCSGLTSLDLTSLNTTNVKNMSDMFSGCSGLTSLDLAPLDTTNVWNMNYMFFGCSGLTTIKTGITFKFIGTNYSLSGTWLNTSGNTFTSGGFPSNIADTYIKISS